MSIKGIISIMAYIATIFVANWAIAVFGVVPVGFGLYAPAAVYVVGVAFTLRDIAQEEAGSRWVLAAIVAGAALSAIVSPQLALASGTAFLFSELADFAVYTPLRRRNWVLAVAASNTVGLIADSLLFLWLAFNSFDYLAGQIIGKASMTLLAVAVIMAWRKLHPTEHSHATV